MDIKMVVSLVASALIIWGGLTLINGEAELAVMELRIAHIQQKLEENQSCK